MRIQKSIKIFVLLGFLVGLLQAANAYTVDGSTVDEEGILVLPPLPQPRIVNGKNAILGQFPYQVLLRSKQGVVCGGAIISQNYVLTAAHCVNNDKPASDFYILAATVTFDQSSTNIPVAQIIRHPDYSVHDNDIALLKLSRPLTFNDNIQSIPLQTEDIPSGAYLIISGWGGIYSGSPIPRNLQYTTVRAINNDECTKRIGRAPNIFQCLEHINGNGACPGDSGGPAAYNGKLAGIANFIINACGSEFPDGYAKVSVYADWIRQNSDVKA